MLRCSSTFRFELALLALVVAVGSAASCAAPTSTTHLWQAEAVTTRAPIRRVIVLGGGMTEDGRRTMEDGFVASLAERGVDATPSYRLFPTLPEQSALRAAVRNAGFEGALVANLRAIKKSYGYMRDSAYPYSGVWGDYGYGADYNYYGSPDWTGAQRDLVADKLVDVETTLWDLRGNDGRGALIWAATTSTANPSTTRDAVKSLTKELVPKLTSAGLVGAEP